YVVALAGVLGVALAALAMPWLGVGGTADLHKLVVRFSSDCDPEAALAPVFARHLVAVRCDGSESDHKGAALEVVDAVRLRNPAGTVALVRELLGVQGVIGAELRRDV